MAYKKKMYKKKYTPKKKKAYKKKKTFKAKRAGKALVRGQTNRAVTMTCRSNPSLFIQNNGGQEQSQQIIGGISLINNATGSQSTAPVLYGQYMSLYRLSVAYNQFTQYCNLYDEFRTTGMRLRFTFPSGGTFGGNNFIALELFYDPNTVAWGANPPMLGIQAYSNYQYIPITVNNTSIVRYFDCKPILKKQGLGWCSTKDLPSILGYGGFTYYGQLNQPVSPSVGWRITTIGLNGVEQIVGQLEVTYYNQFRTLNYGSNFYNPTLQSLKTVETVVTTSINVEN